MLKQQHRFVSCHVSEAEGEAKKECFAAQIGLCIRQPEKATESERDGDRAAQKKE